MRHNANAFSGFTMVEVVVAMAILSTTILAVFGALRSCSTAAHHARLLTESVLLAEKFLVETRLSGNKAFEMRKGFHDSFQWSVQVAPTGVENLGAVHVRVSWQEQHRLQEYDLFSLMQMQSFTEGR